MRKKNKIKTDGDVSFIFFNNSNNYAIVDTKNVEKLQHFCFFDDGKGYAKTRKKNNKIFMHHLIAGFPLYNYVVDHINQNTLDNRECNLRIVDRSVNAINSKIAKNNSLQQKNIHYDNRWKKYRVRIKRNGVWKHIGYYKNLQDAIIARNEYLQKVDTEPCEFRKYI